MEDIKSIGKLCREYVDLGLSVKWAAYNIGANCPEDYRDEYVWGDVLPKNVAHEIERYDNPSIDVDVSGTRYDVARLLWGRGWRMPTKEEMEELLDKCRWEWMTRKGVEGVKVTGLNGNCIFLPASPDEDNFFMGSYWTATCYGGGKSDAYCLNILSTEQALYCFIRYNFHAIRAVHE